MKLRSVCALLLLAALLTAGCAGPGPAGTSSGTAATQATSQATSQTETVTAEVVSAPTGEELFSDRDLHSDYSEEGAALITLQGDTAACTSNAVEISGSSVTILDEGTYILTGTLTDGTVTVNADKSDVTQLVLRGASIHSQSSAALYVAQADKVFLTTDGGTENALSNSGTFTAQGEVNIDGAVFSREDLTLNGEGSLTVTSPAGHGIVSKDSLTVTDGSYDIACAAHALVGKDDVSIAAGSFTLTSGKDGIHAENADDASLGSVSILGGSFTITSEGDGVSAASALYIEDGSFSVTTGGGSANGQKASSDHWGGFMGGGKHGGGSGGGKPGGGGQPGFQQQLEPTQTDASEDSTSLKAFKGSLSVTVAGGSFTVNSADDAFHSNGDIAVSGGSFNVATGDDAFHADSTLTVSGGTLQVSESYEGLEALHIVISGGDITVTASDDGLNAAGGTDGSGMTGGRDGRFGGPGMASSGGSILLSGGNISITASGDGIDANGTLDMTGGHVTVCGPTQGDTATLDYDTRATITGGTFIGTGGSGMAQTFSEASQAVISATVGSQSAGTEIVITDPSGNEILRHTPQLPFSLVILSSPQLTPGESYTVTVGSLSGELTAETY